jgi:acyl-CoA synthetase (AMP-forming)/AMP-acid ligase II
MNGIAHVDVQLATARCGLVTVPLGAYFDPSAAEVASLLNLVGASALIYSRELEDTVAAIRDRCRTVGTWLRSDGSADAYEQVIQGAPESEEVVDVPPSPQANYCIRFTGGTTGRPRAVLHTHAGYGAMVVNQLLALDVRQHDVMALVHPLSHACGQLMYPYLVRGARVVITERFQATGVLEAIERHRVTSIFLVPTAVDALIGATVTDRTRRRSLRTVFYGGAPMSPALLRRGLATFGRVFVQVYGQSETPQAVVVLEKSDHRLSGGPTAVRRLASAGRPIPTVGMALVDGAGAEVAAGEVGEILLRGPQVMAGYWNDAAATAEKMRDGWIRTGDMAWRDEEGYIFLVDRKDDVIVTGGMNVYPREVEDCLLEHPALAEAAVIGVPDARWGEAVWAVVFVRDGRTVEVDELRQHCRRRLARYKVPKSIVFADDPLPKSPVGKLLRREVRAPYWVGTPRAVN